MQNSPPLDAVNSLINDGIVTPEQVAAAEKYGAAQGGMGAAQALVEMKVVTQVQVMRAATQVVGVQFVELSDYLVDLGAASLVTDVQARRLTILPLGYNAMGVLLVAVPMKQIGNLPFKDNVTRTVRCQVEFVVAMKYDIVAKIGEVYRSDAALSELAAGMESTDSAVPDDLSQMTEVTEEAPVVLFANMLIIGAINDRASDIHIEPSEKEVIVRYRIDGVLKEANRSPGKIQSALVSRIKIMAEMNIAEKRVPQDGRLSVTHNGKKIDLRVATLPTVWGEKIVMRILDNTNTRLDLADLGFEERNYKVFQESYKKPYGMILVTGPTGSGKSTTLYGTLNQIATPSVNVITVEDPVEYRIPGINQVQVNVKAGLTFASALRSILRSDPDIVLIGEIRDHETAQIAIEAALTGHLVLTTLHTNDAASAVTRLIEMGIEPFLVGSAIDCVLAQRLCRRLCSSCKIAYAPTPHELDVARFPYDPEQPLPTLYQKVGCSRCSQTGYKGRMALLEVMPVDEKIERMAATRGSTDDISQQAIANGMIPLRDDGWTKVRDGHTSIEEILRVVVV